MTSLMKMQIVNDGGSADGKTSSVLVAEHSEKHCTDSFAVGGTAAVGAAADKIESVLCGGRGRGWHVARVVLGYSD